MSNREIITPLVESVPSEESQGVLSSSEGNINSLEVLAKNIDKMVSSYNTIRMGILKLAQPGDWIVFKSKNDPEGKASLGIAGSMRVSSAIGVSFINWTEKKDEGRDDKGEWFRWEYECDAVFKDRAIRVYGRAGSRDKFFGVAYGKLRAVSDIDEGNIKMAARHNCMKEGVKCLFGLHHQNPSELLKYGIKLADSRGYEFESKEGAVPASTEQTMAAKDERLLTVLDKITQKEGKGANGKPYVRYTIVGMEGDQFTTFSKTLAEEAKRYVELGDTCEVIYKSTQYGKELVGVQKCEKANKLFDKDVA